MDLREFKVSMVYIMRPDLKKKTKKETKKNKNKKGHRSWREDRKGGNDINTALTYESLKTNFHITKSKNSVCTRKFLPRLRLWSWR